MSQHEEHRNKRVIMWVAVVGVTGIIVLLWMLALPRQLARYGVASPNSFGRWLSPKNPSAAGEKKTFSEVLQEQRDQLKTFDNSRAQNVNAANADAPATDTVNANTPH